MKLKVNIPRWLEGLFVAPVLFYRKLRYGYPFRRIKLAHPRYTRVDPEDYHELNKYRWFARGDAERFYAVRRERIGNTKKWALIRMHRQICNAPKGLVVDHKNRRTLDNRRANIRLATPAQNVCNRKKYRRDTRSKYKGLTWIKANKKWRALIGFEGKVRYLGEFTDEVEAAKAYDAAAKKYHGEFACLNFPSQNI